jgi:hypothetical protein
MKLPSVSGNSLRTLQNWRVKLLGYVAYLEKEER